MPRSAPRRTFSLTFSITQRDAVRPLAVVNDLLAETGTDVRAFTLSAGGNEGLALLLDPRVPGAMARSGLFGEDDMPELAIHDSQP